MLVDHEFVAIETVQPILRTEPHEPLVILQDRQHRALREALVQREALKLDIGLLELAL